MATISEFVDEFVREKDQYEQIEKELEILCRAKLENQNIKFAWQSRVKEAESLKKKLQDRSGHYEDDNQNIADIKDLVAGHVNLTRWKDFGLIEDMIMANFDVKNRSQHPKLNQHLTLGHFRATWYERFCGYDGLHFHVTRRVSEGEQHSKLVIEIQVVSAFMWAFATLEHDITYKKLSGEPDKSLRLHIDMLKGIANLGEVAMEQYDEMLFSDSKSPLSQESAAGSDTLLSIAEFAQERKEIISKNLPNRMDNEKILSWISKIKVEGDHNQTRAALGQRYEDSGQWFRSTYDDWVTSLERQIFWLAGSG